MKDLTIIAPIKDETCELVQRSITPLLTEIEGRDVEIILIDNSKYETHTFNHPQIRHIRNGRNAGVGKSFKQGVQLADSERILLMGIDVIIRNGWYERIIDLLDETPNTIFNAAMSGYTDMSEPFRQPRVIRYGAHILYKMTLADLPTHSVLKDDKKFSRILQAKWNAEEPGKGKYTAPLKCLLGACYWMHKSDFLKLNPWSHHKMWGVLEPWLSLQARCHGMDLTIVKDIEVAHYFGRSIIRPGRPDFQYFNQLWLAHTIFSDELRDELVYHLRYGGRDVKVEKLQVNNAMRMIKRLGPAVQKEREYNALHFKNGLITDISSFEKNM